jgi:protocatechuate 3,4-dioxygenase beta subunit
MRLPLRLFRVTSALVIGVMSARAAERLTASGLVIDEATKLAIENATVMVYSAGVKSGYDQFCPTCYLDCGKRATTDAQGAFTLRGLSPDLVFNLLVVREGYSATLLKRVDPAKGAAETAALKSRQSPENPKQVVKGKIVDSQGQPVRDVLIAQQGVIFDMGRALW